MAEDDSWNPVGSHLLRSWTSSIAMNSMQAFDGMREIPAFMAL